MNEREVIARLTPEDVWPDPFNLQARCEVCEWRSIRVAHASRLHEIAANHVRRHGHPVVIERLSA